MWHPQTLFNRSRWNAPIRYRVEDGDRATCERAGTLVLPFERERLLRYLPSGGRVAEIGVARGKFSAWIKGTCAPSFLALVDPWSEQDEAVYYGDTNNAPQDSQNQRYRAVSRRFASTKPGAECRVLRMYSADAVRAFDDNSLDWVYIDANHSYESCLEDLRLWSPKVKADGLLCGHDFALHSSARSARYGVVGAVTDFIKESGFGLAAITVEHFPTYVIAKDRYGPTATKLRQLILSNERQVLQLSDWSAINFEHVRVLDNGLRRSTLMSFGPVSRGDA